jgi:hypothetical protein
MKVQLSSSAELYAEHRRTESRRKRERIAAELQRRHDELNCPPGFQKDRWWMPTLKFEWEPCSWEEGGGHYEPIYESFHRFEFARELP